MACCASFAFFAYLAGSSPVFILGFGLTPSEFGLMFGLNSVALIACSQINARLVRRVGPGAVLRVVTRLHLAATLCLALAAFLWPSFFPVVIPMLVAVGCMGLLNPNVVVGALANQGHQAGSASAVMGTAQFLLGAIGGLLVGLFTDGTPRGLAVLMLVGSIGLVIADRFRPALPKS
jgi:DHA1 family bicyclomycin/chloramphenicol resistance-like MFS transporter